jgi:hypothetical protein
MDSRQIFSKKQRLPWRVIDDEVVIVDLAGNNVLQLNDVGRCIWEQINGEQTVSAIIRKVSVEYEVDPSTADKDTTRFLTTLADKDLIHAKAAAD